MLTNIVLFIGYGLLMRYFTAITTSRVNDASNLAIAVRNEMEILRSRLTAMARQLAQSEAREARLEENLKHMLYVMKSAGLLEVPTEPHVEAVVRPTSLERIMSDPIE